MLTHAILIVLALLFLTALACGPDEGATTGQSNQLKVVTSVSPITNIVENIGGTRIDLEGLIPEGADSHEFEPAPSVGRVMAKADLIVLNGLFLEEPSLKMAEANKKKDAVILLLADSTINREEWAFDFSFPESEGHPNPHLWPNPPHALRYGELVHEQLTRLDPNNTDYYTENLSQFRKRVEDLDARIRAAIETIPPNNRKLLTYHDSWIYFARRYGLEVVGAVQPSDFKEPSAQEVAQVIDQIKALRLPAIFGSEVFPSKVMEQIAREGGAKFIDQLRDDDLPGKPGEPGHSYLGLMLQNMEIMVPALAGSAAALAGFDPGPVFEGKSVAKYPQ